MRGTDVYIRFSSRYHFRLFRGAHANVAHRDPSDARHFAGLLPDLAAPIGQPGRKICFSDAGIAVVMVTRAARRDARRVPAMQLAHRLTVMGGHSSEISAWHLTSRRT